MEIIKPERERGTLNETQPKQPIILISLVCIASAALSTALLLYLTPHLLATTNKDVMKLLFIACLGSISTLVGVVFSDSLSHVVSFGVAVSLRYVMCYVCKLLRVVMYGAAISLILYILFSYCFSTLITPIHIYSQHYHP